MRPGTQPLADGGLPHAPLEAIGDQRQKGRAVDARLPLTSALLEVMGQSVSFATPGHRGGRSWHARHAAFDDAGDPR